ncbi:hypothetical protein [Oleiharenicola lentus]|uniref:hypothetical protein n=1 Tax=Oleiharenicola lentus TaxID=2508720 RepID=UPI003F663CE1
MIVSRHHWSLCALVAAVVCTPGWSADLRVQRCREPIVMIDGKLDEAIWQRAVRSDAFVGPLQPDKSVKPAGGVTQVRALWDNERLYFAFECEGAPTAATLTERDALLHKEEVVEIFLDFQGEGRELVELQVSSKGVVADLYHVWGRRPTYPAHQVEEAQRQHLNIDRSWNLAGVEVATAPWIEQGVTRGWIAEISIPVASLALQGKGTTRLETEKNFRVNFAHYRYPPNGTEKPVLSQSTWRPVLLGRPHVSPMAMGTARCEDDSTVAVQWRASWRDAAKLLVPDAHRAFLRATTASRESRFGEAVTLMNLQPRTETNLNRAIESLQALVQENRSDEFGLGAQYYLGRIEQAHRFVPNLARALEYYDALMRANPRHLYAQMAAVKAVVIRLYQTDSGSAAERLRAGNARSEFFTMPEAQRDYHLAMADAYVRFGGDQAALLEHLLAAEWAGHLQRVSRADLYVRIADAAEKAGRKEMAALYCKKFLAEGTREARVNLVKRRLAALEATP